MVKDLYPTIAGTALVVVGVILLLSAYLYAVDFIESPDSFTEQYFPSEEEEANPPAALFGFGTQDMNASFLDYSRDGDAEITQWDWDFGDSKSSTEQNPQHEYDGDGMYTVQLTVTDADGNSDDIAAIVNIQANGSDSGGTEQGLGDAIDVNLDITQIFKPIAYSLLMLGGLALLAGIGAKFCTAGWNLIKPRPVVVHVKVKPKDVQIEPDHEAYDRYWKEQAEQQQQPPPEQPVPEPQQPAPQPAPQQPPPQQPAPAPQPAPQQPPVQQQSPEQQVPPPQQPPAQPPAEDQ